MPKVDVELDRLFSLLGEALSETDLELALETAKGELDEPAGADGVARIELNDTNRPDLWSTAGVARQLRVHRSGQIPEYPFFSSAGSTRDAGERRVVVEAELRSIRPYIAAFAIRGKEIDDGGLRDLIQTQEKLTTNFGQHRRSIAMGVYRTALIEYPVRYRAADPQTTRFVPLGETRELDLHQIIREHPKGHQYGPIVEGFSKFPFLDDANGEVLSFPPVINSARVGAVEVGDAALFIELTGTDMETLLLACAITACDLADAGYEILPVSIEYPYDTPVGREVVTPYYFQPEAVAELATIRRIAGEQLSAEDAVSALRAMGVSARTEGETIIAKPPEYRNDFLHAVDLAEDVVIGRGMDSFVPEMPRDFTVGRLTDAERFCRQAISIMVGLGFQEMVYPNLGSALEFIHKMRPIPVVIDTDDAVERGDSTSDRGPARGQEDEVAAQRAVAAMRPIRIANPMSANYEYVRASVIPQLLGSESISANAAYPHNLFEVGKVAIFDAEELHGTRTFNSLGFMTADAAAGFTLAGSLVRALCYYLGVEHVLVAVEDERFIPGRAATILLKSTKDGSAQTAVGVVGEIHPQLLENFGIQMPCTAAEIDLDAMREHLKG